MSPYKFQDSNASSGSVRPTLKAWVSHLLVVTVGCLCADVVADGTWIWVMHLGVMCFRRNWAHPGFQAENPDLWCCHSNPVILPMIHSVIVM